MEYLIKLSIIIILFSCNKNEEPQEQNDLDCSGDYSTAGVLVDINEEIYNDDESVNNYSRYSWTSDGNDRILVGNGIPNHEVGTFPNVDNPTQNIMRYGKKKSKTGGNRTSDDKNEHCPITVK